LDGHSSPTVASASFSFVIAAALSGFAFSLSLIVAIGAQNSFVLRQGLRREHVALVIVICSLSDIALIAAGVAGIGVLIRQVPHLLAIVTLAGIAFLLGYGALALRRALRPSALHPGNGVALTVRAAVVTTLALTYLNPGVYLDTVILLGSIANTHDQPWWFATGAAIGSVAWFTALGYGARLLSPLFARPMAWRVLDVAVAVIMVAIAVRLAFSGAISGTGHTG
jgi:L-lysine exporter family protein LysE/ArgO